MFRWCISPEYGVPIVKETILENLPGSLSVETLASGIQTSYALERWNPLSFTKSIYKFDKRRAKGGDGFWVSLP